MPNGVVLAFDEYPTNGHLIKAVAGLGYLDGHVLDATWGEGVWWKQWQPQRLTTLTGTPRQGASVVGDFTRMSFKDKTFNAVAFDPPYRLNGRPDPTTDRRYGVDVRTKRVDRHALILNGLTECLRVARRYVLVKCMDQIESDRLRHQSWMIAHHALEQGWDYVDRFYFVDRKGGRAQPERSRKDGAPSVQHHARNNGSVLMVLARPANGKRPRMPW